MPLKRDPSPKSMLIAEINDHLRKIAGTDEYRMLTLAWLNNVELKKLVKVLRIAVQERA